MASSEPGPGPTDARLRLHGAWAAQEERLQSLLRTYELAKIELETGKRPPEPSQAQG